MQIKGIFIILLYYALGNTVSCLTGRFIPGSVIGMLLLFVSLVLKLVEPASVRAAAEFLTKNMSIFFVPASIGIMEQWGIIRANLFAWVGVCFISTIMVLLSAGLVQDGLASMSASIKKRKDNA